MKISRAPSALLLLTISLPATGYATARPANFDGVAQDAAKNKDPQVTARESEFTILITIDAERRVFFKKEPVGTCDDVGPLKERVKRAIKENRQTARDRADKEMAKYAGTVFICATPDLKYGDVVKVIDAIRKAGGKPIDLDTDCPPPS
ncbi:MAG TPA: biopolymer transporter ExbD [Pyrinomonadaceae bacterium]|jgi:biopolymer transport protein ExbD